VGRRRVFAGALDWPGWCRSGRDADAALQALVAYGPRYAAALGPARFAFTAPADASAFEVVERLAGNATTDFGAPGVAPARDARRLDDTEAERLALVLRACWAKLDRAAEAAAGAELRKGPRGGGRELDAIIHHVLEADKAYLARLGGRYGKTRDADPAAELAGVRQAIFEAVASRVHGGEPLLPTRRSGAVWTPRYAVRRSAWHALDHAWEIEDRATAASTGPA
jgi:hypothetical protein